MPFIGVQPTASAITATSLDGVTSSAAELNILDGVTSTAAELNYLDITALGTSQASKVVTADSSGNVGIGASPNAYANYTTLTLNGATSSALDFEGGGTLMAEVYAAANDLVLQTTNSDGQLFFKSAAGSNAMTIDANQNVGIGSASNFSGARVAINNTPPTAFGSPMLQIGQETFVGSGYYSLGLGYTGSGYTKPPAEIAAVSTSSSGGTTADIVFGTRSVTTNTAVTERMRIISTGVVQFENGLSEKYTAVTSSSNATTVDLRAGTNFSHTLTENTTFTFSNPAASGRVSTFTLKLVQDSSASGYTVTWPASVDWPSATAPTLTATASAVDYFVFITHDGGTNWYGFTAGQAFG